MGGSQLKRSHRTHAFNQPAGIGYDHAPLPGGSAGRDELDAARAALARLTELVPDPDARADAIGVAPHIEHAWQLGRMMPSLRASRRRIARALDRHA